MRNKFIVCLLMLFIISCYDSHYKVIEFVPVDSTKSFSVLGYCVPAPQYAFNVKYAIVNRTIAESNFDYNNGEAPFELHFSYIDEELNISDAISGTGHIRRGFMLTYLHYNNNVNEFSAEFESFTQSPTYYACFMYVGVDNGYNNYTPKPECLTVECVRDGNSSGTFDLSVSGDISYEADNNRFYVYALFTYQNVADAQFYANITFKYKDEEMEIDSTVTNRITFIPKKK